jgi:low temperature requirement protein LtrA
MVAGIVLLALGMKKTLEHPEETLATVPAVGLVGGVATFLLAIVAFRWRLLHTLGRVRPITAAILIALVPIAVEVPAYVTVALVVAVVWGLILYEVVRYADFRDSVRHELAREGSGSVSA